MSLKPIYSFPPLNLRDEDLEDEELQMNEAYGNSQTTLKETEKEPEVNVNWIDKEEKEKEDIIIVGVTSKRTGTSLNMVVSLS